MELENIVEIKQVRDGAEYVNKMLEKGWVLLDLKHYIEKSVIPKKDLKSFHVYNYNDDEIKEVAYREKSHWGYVIGRPKNISK